MITIPGIGDRFCTDTFTLSSPVTITSILIQMTKKRPQYEEYSLYEVEAYGSGTYTTNLLLNQNAIASSVENGWYASYVTDGNMPSPGSPSRWSSAKGLQDPQWLTITLSSPTQMNSIVLKWLESYAAEYCVIVKP